MSFLNPVNEPVLRFSSTDPGAPQINYNARVAGDVKTVLKACLVTGYGDKASAGWSIVNEVNHVAEFVSPAAAMSDYRLGIDDTSASSTTWYYQYQNVRKTLNYSSPTKSLDGIDKTNATNGWQLLVTERGFMLIELIYATYPSKLSARLTYFGAIKSALDVDTGENICFYNIGHAGQGQPSNFYNSYPVAKLGNYNPIKMLDSTGLSLIDDYKFGLSTLDLVSRVYLANNQAILGQLPALWTTTVNNTNDLYGAIETSLGDSTVLRVTGGFNGALAAYSYARARNFFINTDYWEY